MVNIRKFLVIMIISSLALSGSVSYIFRSTKNRTKLKSTVICLDEKRSSPDCKKNPARQVGHEKHIRYRRGNGDMNEAAGENGKNKVDLNSAGLEELQLAPGIGPAKAQAIIDYRERYGDFSCIEELIEVKGIGSKTFDKIKSYYMVK